MDKSEQISTSHLIVRMIDGLDILKCERDLTKNGLPEEIRQALQELENIRSYFDSVDEPELIDYAIYREKAILIRLSYLFKKARSDRNYLKTSNV